MARKIKFFAGPLHGHEEDSERVPIEMHRATSSDGKMEVHIYRFTNEPDFVVSDDTTAYRYHRTIEVPVIDNQLKMLARIRKLFYNG